MFCREASRPLIAKLCPRQEDRTKAKTNKFRLQRLRGICNAEVFSATDIFFGTAPQAGQRATSKCRAGNYNSVDGSAHWEGDELLQRGAGLSSNPGGELRTRGMRDSCMTGWGVEACRSRRAPSVNRRSSKQNILPHGKPDTFKYCGRGPGMFYISPPMRSSESIFLILALACSILGFADVLLSLDEIPQQIKAGCLNV